MRPCICPSTGQPPDETLDGERFILGNTCPSCGQQWISIIIEPECPFCGWGKCQTDVELVVCYWHGTRGPQNVWVSNAMRELTTPLERRDMAYYVKRLKEDEPFTNARYGDGDWLTIFGYYELRNSNGCQFEEPLSDAVQNALRKGLIYDRTILSHANWRFHRHILEWLEQNEVTVPWGEGDVVLGGILGGTLFPLFEQIRERRVLYVGPHQLNQLDFFSVLHHIETPPKNAFHDRNGIISRVMKAIERYRIDFVGWSSGGAAKVFIDDVYENTAGEIYQMDFGSCFDGFFPPLPHVNQEGSRSFIRKGGHDWDELHRLNATGE